MNLCAKYEKNIYMERVLSDYLTLMFLECTD